ncbi:MAG: hypothetical protein GVY11_00530 [Gammaproteobacteria bacterium]|nr:hypothetical protein [Gammaproteobacteria bacterium]
MPRLLGLAVLVALMTACASGPIKVSGEPPLTRLDRLAIDGDELVLAFAVRNVNDKPLDVPRMQYRLVLDGVQIADFDEGRPQLSIPPRGRDIVRIRVPAPADTLAALNSLARGEQANLPWRLEVTVEGIAKRAQPEPATGFLHSVPGQSNQFR